MKIVIYKSSYVGLSCSVLCSEVISESNKQLRITPIRQGELEVYSSSGSLLTKDRVLKITEDTQEALSIIKKCIAKKVELSENVHKLQKEYFDFLESYKV